jgi:hypothetical protein
MPNVRIPPACPVCSEPMTLARIGPLKGYVDIEKRTYECAKCGEEQDWVVKEL